MTRISSDAWNDQLPVSAAAKAYSLAKIETIIRGLTEIETQLKPVACISCAGSLARLEAHPSSDIDLVVLFEDGTQAGVAEKTLAIIVDSVAASGLRLPKAGGIYAQPLQPQHLLRPGQRGQLDESKIVFGTRMHLLLDARALFGELRMRQLQAEVVDWFCCELPAGTARFDFLIDELKRYAISYRTWQRFKLDRTTDDSRALRQVKFFASRIPTFAGLYALVLRARQSSEPIEWLISRLHLTPLERLQVCGVDNAALVQQIADTSEILLERLADDVVRARLLECGPDAANPQAPYCDVSKQLLQAGRELEQLIAELLWRVAGGDQCDNSRRVQPWL